MKSEFTIDLTRPPARRWRFDPSLVEQARRLVDVYFTDMGVTDDVASMVLALARPVVPEGYWEEMESIAAQLEVPPVKVLICNAYYDLIKSVIGCTAFAVDTESGPLHARNLDWWTENRLLNDTTFVCRFVGAPAGDFVTVGTFSGMAPGRFTHSARRAPRRERTHLRDQRLPPDGLRFRSSAERVAGFLLRSV